jgi:hypothetical protein
MRIKAKRDVIVKTEEYLIQTADRCSRLAEAGREIVADLESLRNELMAKAVELDTNREKKQAAR